MARKTSSAPFLKYFFPSYYLRRPRRLGFVSLVFVGLVFFFMDRQNQARELEEMGTKLQQLEGIKGGLEAQVDNLKKENAEALKRAEKLSQLAAGKSQVESQRHTPLQASGAKGSAGAANKGDASRGVKADPLILGVGVGSNARKLLPKKDPPLAKVQPQNQGGAQAHGQGQAQGAAGAQGTGSAQAQAGGASGGGEDPGKAAAEAKRVAEERRESVRKGMEHAWKAYETYAWGEDELQPLSRRGVSNFGHMGATIIDSLDTLFIMGLTDQFNKAKDWVAQNLDFDKDYQCSVFETTIRVLGGLLSAYDLSGDAMFLGKARQLADRLLPAWNTPSGIPWHYLNLRSGAGDSPGWSGGSTVLADAGTTQVEMIALTQRTNDTRYAEASERVITRIQKEFPADGLVPIYINPQTGTFTGGQITFGAMGDSFYEYLLKVWVQGGKTPTVKRYRDMWEKSMKGMMDNLVRHTDNGFTYIAERNGGGIINKMDHLLCFTPGMLALGAVDADEALATEYLSLAKEVTKTCYEFYRSQPSGLSGENYQFHSGLSVGQTYNIGRPETVEALFYLWRATKDPIYRDWGWQIWQAFEKNCKVDAGYTGLRNVAMDPPPKDDMMQSFFLAETLKYLYLLFSPDDVIPLDQWVFNTEAHPVKIVPRNQQFTGTS